jgi:hypothetical protein
VEKALIHLVKVSVSEIYLPILSQERALPLDWLNLLKKLMTWFIIGE